MSNILVEDWSDVIEVVRERMPHQPMWTFGQLLKQACVEVGRPYPNPSVERGIMNNMMIYAHALRTAESSL